jgi:hypothetical protein
VLRLRLRPNDADSCGSGSATLIMTIIIILMMIADIKPELQNRLVSKTGDDGLFFFIACCTGTVRYRYLLYKIVSIHLTNAIIFSKGFIIFEYSDNDNCNETDKDDDDNDTWHVKYLCPPTLPSFFPRGSSYSIPIHLKGKTL